MLWSAESPYSLLSSLNRRNIKVIRSPNPRWVSKEAHLMLGKCCVLELLVFLHKVNKPRGEPLSILELWSNEIKKLTNFFLPFLPVLTVSSTQGACFIYFCSVMCNPWSLWEKKIPLDVYSFKCSLDFCKLVTQKRRTEKSSILFSILCSIRFWQTSVGPWQSCPPRPVLHYSVLRATSFSQAWQDIAQGRRRQRV